MDVRLANAAIQLVKSAGKICLDGRNEFASELKSDGSLVTSIDLKVDNFLREEIGKQFPEDTYFSEEAGGDIAEVLKADSWLADPIDGTQPFSVGLPSWGICLAHFSRGKIDFGTFYSPLSNEIYWTWNDRDACHRSANLKRCGNFDDPKEWSILVNSDFHRIFDSSFPGRVRSFGCTGAHLAYVASGASAACLIHKVSLWDIAAGVMLLDQGAMRVAYLDGTDISLFDYVEERNNRPALVAPRRIWADIAETLNFLGATQR